MDSKIEEIISTLKECAKMKWEQAGKEQDNRARKNEWKLRGGYKALNEAIAYIEAVYKS